MRRPKPHLTDTGLAAHLLSVGVEVKSTDAVDQNDFKGLTTLRDRLGDDFVHGFVCHTGPRSLSFGDRLTAIPLSALWDR